MIEYLYKLLNIVIELLEKQLESGNYLVTAVILVVFTILIAIVGIVLYIKKKTRIHGREEENKNEKE